MGAPAAAVRDPGQLLDVDMDQFTGPVTLVSLDGFFDRTVTGVETTDTGLVQNSLPRRGRKTDLVSDVVSTPSPSETEVKTPAPLRTWCPVRGPTPTADRSCNPSVPSSLNRFTHLRTVLASTWNRSAVASTAQPLTRTQSTIVRRCRGVRRAFGC